MSQSDSSSSGEEEAPDYSAVSRSAFKRDLEGWLAANHDRVVGAYESGAGWEIWLHVELFLAVKHRDAKADIQREPHGYARKSLRADLVLNARSKASTCIIEIKTETLAESAINFWKRVGGDVDKGATLSKALRAEGAEPLAVALFISGDTWKLVGGEAGETKQIGTYIGLHYSIG